MSDETKHGAVKFSRELAKKGTFYGYVTVDSSGENLFFYSGDYKSSDMPPRMPEKGDRLSFKVVRGPKGSNASQWTFVDELLIKE
ncbi:MAG: hypothetical protein HOG08_03190 [Candidatus Magasanikbacteria bacterium]|jgi:cold shock CspA family protein|nr:hypothetical protein [Candidatus Magasanikbacteria bacterium]